MKRDIQLDPALKGQMPLNWLWKQVGYFSHVALVTTMSETGHVAVEVNTWNTPVGSNMVMMQCASYHDTYRNILTQGEFVFNYPRVDLIDQVIQAGRAKRGPTLNEVSTIGLTPIPSTQVKPPRIAQCVAHLECALLWHRATEMREKGELVVIVGQVVAASVEDVADIYEGSILYAERDEFASCPVDRFRPWPEDVENN
ncbi:MAG: flavin reductase family protein [Chloroflexi bacterium]|nr:flavin reductase family protein [Chloroflexota bacterium]